MPLFIAVGILTMIAFVLAILVLTNALWQWGFLMVRMLLYM
jgi:hypothetical protein